MGIKLIKSKNKKDKPKKIKTKSNSKIKVLAVMVIIITTITGYVSAMSSIKVVDNFARTPLYETDYFGTREFRDLFTQLLIDTVDVYLVYKDEKSIEDGMAVNEQELIREFAQNHGLDVGIVESGEYIINTTIDGYNINTAIDGYSYEDLQLLQIEFENYRKQLIQNQLKRFKEAKENLESYENFKFYLSSKDGGADFSNDSLSSITSQEKVINIDGVYLSDTNKIYKEGYFGSVEKILEENGYAFSAAVTTNPLKPGDQFYEDYTTFNEYMDEMPSIISGIIISAVTVLVLFCYLIYTAGRDGKDSELTMKGIDKIYNDIHTVLVYIVCRYSTIIGLTIFNEIRYRLFNDNSISEFYGSMLGLIIVFNVIIGLNYLVSMSRQIKAKQLFRNTFIGVISRGFIRFFSNRTYRGFMVVLLVMYAGVNILLTYFMCYRSSTSGFFLMLIIIFNLICVTLLARGLNSLTNIMLAVKTTSKGDYGYSIDLRKISSSFYDFANDVCQIQSGLKSAVDEAIKGERMKADLITNVSHDLKTPLTSIISYVGLLDKEELNNTAAKSYVTVLVEKSQRLKQLIEDLIEASKASSGNLSVSKERLDLRQLVHQATGEFVEKVERAGLCFIISATEDVIIYADGKHMWRILENLISNIIKYAMPNSRVYVDIIKDENVGRFLIKNISEQQLDINIEQLTERFVRGDKSRTTEGSGLGLSIAKSLTELQNGKFRIETDGDLFKVTIDMPLWKNENGGNEVNDDMKAT